MSVQYNSPIKIASESEYDSAPGFDEIVSLAKIIEHYESFVIGLSDCWETGKKLISAW